MNGSVCWTIPRTMDRWAGKVAIVTGASAGIGAAISKALVNHGVKVVGLARRLDKLKELSATLGKDKFYAVQCDMEKEEDILKAFKWVEKEFHGADILINNAGIIGAPKITENATEEYHKVLNVNVIAPAICAREFIQSIKNRNRPGHIINIDSIAGHYAEAIRLPIGMYCSSKYALRAMSTELRHEIIDAKLRIKIMNISPGAVLTEMYQKASENNKDAFKDMNILHDKDIADAAIYGLGTPEGVEVHEIIIMPQNTPIVIAN